MGELIVSLRPERWRGVPPDVKVTDTHITGPMARARCPMNAARLGDILNVMVSWFESGSRHFLKSCKYEENRESWR